MTSKNSPIKSQFQLIQDKRLKQIQQKLNKTCCQYDSLMPLLELVDFIPHIASHQKQLKNIQKKIKSCQDRLKQKNLIKQKVSQRNLFLYKQLDDVQLGVQRIKKQLVQLSLAVRDEPQGNNEVSRQYIKNEDMKQQNSSFYTHAFEQNIQLYQKYLKQALAQYKTQMDIHLSKCRNVSQSKIVLGYQSEKIIKDQFKLVDQVLQKIDNDVQLTKKQLATQNLVKFHQFNYHRIQYQIITINESIDLVKQRFQGNKIEIKQQNQITSQIKQEIQKCKWQIIGSKKYYLRQLSKLYYISKDLFQTNKMQIKITQEFQQVQNLFKQLNFKFNQFQLHVYG